MIKRGEIYYADLSPIKGSEQGGVRPCLIIQNDVGNKFSPCTIVAIITTRTTKAKLPTQLWLPTSCGLPRNSMVECEQIRTIDKKRLGEKCGEVDPQTMQKVNECLRISVGV
jgi:mRNA interferase MazF